MDSQEWITFQRGCYVFGRSLRYSFDVDAYEENLSEARRAQAEAPERAVQHLREADLLYGGDFLENLAADSEWAQTRQEELRRAREEAQLLQGSLLAAQARHTEAADAYRKAISQDRFLEEAHRGLMRCYAAIGERGRALRHYEELVGLLEDELGSSPAPETRMLYERLRTTEEA